jgi:uncharacterized protein
LRLGTALVIALLAQATFAETLQPIPPLAARVTDLTGTLSPAQRSALEEKLALFEARKGTQVAVLLVPTTAPEEIEQYGIRVVDAWRLGRAQSDDGALLLVAKDDRRVRIEVGQGLEGALTDLQSKRIIDETIVPAFRAGDFAGGVEAGVDRILGVIEGEELPPPEPRGPSARGLSEWAPILLWLLPFVAVVLHRMLGPSGPFLAATAAAGLGWLATRQLEFAIGVAVFTVLIGLVGFRRGWSSGRRGPGTGAGWGGGFGGGGFGGGGGGGGGGFSGGGGGFSGGGASGSW